MDFVKGTCMLMCPESEIELREREGLVHILESRPGLSTGRERRITADHKRMVKMFSRSAAGKEMLRPDQLRPPPTLKKTINYLLGTVAGENQLPWATVYTFVTDRLRSIRQDMVIQQPPPHMCSALLEPIIRFHALAAYRLCEEPLEIYDPHLNKIYLNESLKLLLNCYDTTDCPSEVISLARDQMEAIYGLLHLGNVDALDRMLSLSPPSESLLSIALRMSLAHFRNDYVTECKLLHHLPPLLACVAVQNLPHTRRKALSVMNSAYSSRNLQYPLDHLTQILCYPDALEAAAECKHYGLKVKDTSVHFVKGSFDFKVKECKPKRLQFIDVRLEKIALPELLLTTCEAYS